MLFLHMSDCACSILTISRNGVDITVDGGMVLSSGRHSKL
jgi:hypothetical protein